MLVLAGLADPPSRMEELRIRHLERYRLKRLQDLMLHERMSGSAKTSAV